MLGVAVVILGIILVTGHPEPPPQASTLGRVIEPTLTPPDRVRSFEQQLASDEARLRQVAERAQVETAVGATAPTARNGHAAAADETRQREEQSLFADNVAFTLRSSQPLTRTLGGTAPVSTPSEFNLPDDLARLEQAILTLAATAPRGAAPEPPLQPAPPPSQVTPVSAAGESAGPAVAPLAAAGAQAPAAPPPAPPESSENPAPGPRSRLLEGTVIEAVLINRLDGTFAGPVACLVTTPVYSHNRRHLLIPAGARLLGRAEPVQTWGDSRLAVSFHRLLMPDGRTYSLDLFQGLSQSGEAGLKDQVDRHYWQVFGASLAIGALSGLAQLNTRSGIDTSFGDSHRQGAGTSLANSAGRVLDRYLNVLPTITIREGYRIKVYLTGDVDLPPHTGR